MYRFQVCTPTSRKLSAFVLALASQTLVMDWARDDEELSDHDLHNVFKYEPKQCTVVKIVESGRV
jgi:hypothetical protein